MEFYIMPMFVKLQVSDIQKSAKWYRMNLGFTSVFQYRNAQNQVIMDHLRLGKYQDIMLIQEDYPKIGRKSRINFSIKEVDKITNEVSKQAIVEPLLLQPWNAYELTVSDPDGYLITLTQPNIEDVQDFDTVIKNIHKRTRYK